MTFKKALEVARRIGDVSREVTILSNLGLAAAWSGAHREAIDYYEQALAAGSTSSPPSADPMTPLNLSASHGALGNYQEAIRYGEIALATFRRTKSQTQEALALSNIAEAHLCLGDFKRAREGCQQALDLFIR